MCRKEIYFNTYADGDEVVTEKMYPCRDGHRCSRPDVRTYNRKFPFSRLSNLGSESHRSLSERIPTPYFPDYVSSSKSSSSRRRNSEVYSKGVKSNKHYDYDDPYILLDPYDYQRSSRRERDRYEKESSKSKHSSSTPLIVYKDRDSRSRSKGREYSDDISIGLADDYDRRRSRDDSRDGSDSRHRRRNSVDIPDYVFVEESSRPRERRRMSMSSYPEPTGSRSRTGLNAYAYTEPLRRSSTVIHHSDGSLSKPKQLRWEDEVRAKRAKQNAEIASRPALVSSSGEPLKGILKRSNSDSYRTSSKGKDRDWDDIAELRGAVERMELSRGRDRKSKVLGEDWGGFSHFDDDYGEKRRKRGRWDENYWY
ncbi:uncharacterized protein CTHT_0021990 [Thermochaetoides thermophila DSM 1495]|uniref:Uncharacterized protein n=1 Tax=Chaetomium thermophilum (strain DSM 1495 / CBS 144.50 / IMI 039719) TaxID=759272 RepID=G0S3Z6_CHATD|nr:hypothetical protein CTHT_0021990 [Thermochaetoides thermophila DSM 1495]EGS20372.1 hypothetical protein CTHT_0021990 [Thermochaetoides thermophila DSM 1495]